MIKKHFIYFLGILIFSIVLCGAASAATIPVNNITGIQNAINTAHNGDTLKLTAGTYKEHDIMVNKNLTITGPQTTGNNPPIAVVDAQNQGRVFNIPSGVSVTLQYLLIQNGNTKTDSADSSGGGIYNNGTLNIKNCTITKNTAENTYGWSNGGGIYNYDGTLTLTGSKLFNNTAEDYGGGIYNYDGTLTLTGSKLFNNNAYYGGGIYNEDGTTNFTSCNLYNNNATGNNYGGGGIYNYVGTVILTASNLYNNTATLYGGGIYNDAGKMTLTGSNLYNNTAYYGGGISNDQQGWASGTMTVTGSSLYNNNATCGGGIINGGTLTLTSCNVYKNTADSSAGGFDNSGTLILTGCNVYDNTAKYSAGGIFNKNICSVINCVLYNNTVTGNNYGGGAICNSGTLTVIGSKLYNNTAIYGGAIRSTGNLNANTSIFTNNAATRDGGAICNSDTLAVTDCTFMGNTADNGGCIVSWDDLIVNNCTFTKNKANSTAGAIMSTNLGTITGSKFTGNTAAAGGGAIYTYDGYDWSSFCTLDSCNFTNNTVDDYKNSYGRGGGALLIDYSGTKSSIATVKSCNFTCNTAGYSGEDSYMYDDDNGGAILSSGNLIVSGSIFTNNKANGNNSGGGAIRTEGTCTVTDSTFTGNTASCFGGAIDHWGDLCTVTNSTFNNNNATAGGGAIYSFNSLSVNNSTFTENIGGAIDANLCTVTNSTFTGNTVDGSGGAISGNDLIVDYCFFTGNTATCGGAINTGEFFCYIANSTFTGNTADEGGAIAITMSYWDNISRTVEDCTFCNNNARDRGGAIVINGGNATVLNSIFTGNTVTSTQYDAVKNIYYSFGGVIFADYGGTIDAHSNWFYGNSNYEIYSRDNAVNAENNWWDSDNPPSRVYGESNNGGYVYVTPWLVDTTPPTISTVDPANGATEIASNKIIKVTFNEPVKAGVNNWIELKNSAGTVILITWSITGNTLKIISNSLLPESKYTLILHTGCIVDYAGYSIPAMVSSFIVGTPPSVTSTDPVNNAVNVARDKVITVTFNEPVKAGTMWIELYNTTGTKTPIPITTTINGNILTINHATLLANGTKYILAFHTGSITDLAGNSLAGVTRYFTTSTDATIPTVTNTDPVNNAVNVARNKVITVTFNEPIKTGTMWIELYNTVGTKTIIPITTSISGNVLTINHATLLGNGIKYILCLHTGSITDLAGNSLTGVARYFTTSTDATIPTVTNTDPVNNAVNVARNKVITVTFSEPIKAGTMWIELYNTTGTKTPITITTTINSNTLTINHTTLLATGTKYTLALHTGSITDLAGNNLTGVARYFTTGTT